MIAFVMEIAVSVCRLTVYGSLIFLMLVIFANTSKRVML